KERLLSGFTTNVLNGLKSFEYKYGLNLQYNLQNNLQYKENVMPSEIFSMFLVEVASKINGNIYIMIDEYDHFANELLSFQTDVFEETISKTGFVRKWYEVLKAGTDKSFIQRIFITGVSPVTMDSLTSGFNIGKNKTRDLRFNECLGFTQDEVKNVLKEALGDAVDVEEEMPVLRKYYNGYLFNEDAVNRIFNSDMVLYYASEFGATNSPPKQLIDTNISSDYKKIANLFTLKNREQNFEVLKEIIEGTTQKTLITAEFSLAKNFTKDDFKSLLFYLGFLTIDKPDLNEVNLIVPNYVIKELYFDFFGEVLSEEAAYDLDVSDIRASIAKVAKYADIKSFIEIVTTTLKKLSNRDFIQFNEKYVKIIMITYFMMSRIYYVKSEYEVDNGYIDIALLPRPGVKAPYNAIFEVKYIKKSEFTKGLLEEKVKSAKEQIAKYVTSPELKEMDNLLKWVLVFCGDELLYEERV
ncbi:MAG: AAA family ATPase, partial [Clostridiales bacterium]|nr:AAA family ATPase [Clostridiales bacterium]